MLLVLLVLPSRWAALGHLPTGCISARVRASAGVSSAGEGTSSAVTAWLAGWLSFCGWHREPSHRELLREEEQLVATTDDVAERMRTA